MYWSFFSAKAMMMHPVIMMRDPTTEVALGPHLNLHDIKIVSSGLFIMYTTRAGVARQWQGTQHPSIKNGICQSIVFDVAGHGMERNHEWGRKCDSALHVACHMEMHLSRRRPRGNLQRAFAAIPIVATEFILHKIQSSQKNWPRCSVVFANCDCYGNRSGDANHQEMIPPVKFLKALPRCPAASCRCWEWKKR